MSYFYENFNFSVFWSVFWAILCLIVGIYFWETYRIVSYISFFLVLIYAFYIVRNHFWKKEKFEEYKEEVEEINNQKDRKMEKDFNDFLMDPKLVKSKKIMFAMDYENTIEQWKSKNNFKRTKLDIYIEKNTNNKYVGYLAKKNRKGELEFRIKSGQCNSKDATLISLQKQLH